ncbi:hypothetical protein HPB47_014693 [Ixodes persulcatus]|uniref:Uncharacterized protein n=1 Tax=Ixodes persulcatus TaxID=34615 RepID=A0AC60QVE3_IXOPE|nr:hypothetical protein HPB47_014693 [Ixodes persulcatus]
MTPSKGYVHGSFGKRSRFTKPRGTAGGRRSTAPDAATSATSPKPSRPSRGSASTKADELTTFERKITLLDRPVDLPKPTDDVRNAALNGYCFVDVSAVKTLVSALLCPNCHGNELHLKESGVGASLQFVVVCRACGDIVTTPQSATSLDVNMVAFFRTKYMHLACLGVMQRLLLNWVCQGYGKRLSREQRSHLNEGLWKSAKSFPCHFQRRPRGTVELDRWKATESRPSLSVGLVTLK